MSREHVIKKRGLTLSEYYRFARDVGKRIDFNKRMKALAAYYDISIYHLGPKIDERFMDTTRYGQHVPEDPVDCLLLYIEELESSYEDTTDEGVIAGNIRPTPKKSFFRYGDRNCLTSSIKRNYINDADGTPLDTQAQNLSITFEREFTPDMLIEFMYAYEKGPATYKSAHEKRLQEMSEHFAEVTGGRLNPDFAALFCKEFLTSEQRNEIHLAPF